MMGSLRDNLFVILFHGMLWMDCISALTVTPKLTSVVVGDSVAITCNKAPYAEYPVDWKHRPVGANDPIHFYSKAAAGFKEEYRADFSVDENNALGQYSLVIKNVKPGYAGAYFCVDNDPYSTTETAELVVIVSSPECSSNVSKDGAVGENTCNIEPDVVEMTCSVKYQGNSSPSLAWRDEGTKSAIQSGVSSTSEPTRSNITLVTKANSTLNQRSFYCEVVNTQKQYLSDNYSCSGTKIKVMYAVNTESKQTPNEDGEIQCVANTSETPSFEWKSDVGFDNKVKTLKIDSSKNTLERLQCFVHYTMRGKNCTLMSTIVGEEGMTLFISPCPGCGSAIAAAVIVPLLLLLLIFIVVFVAYKKGWLNKSKMRQTFEGLGWIKREETASEDEKDEEGFDVVFLRFSVNEYPIPADSFGKLSTFLRHRTRDHKLKNNSVEKLESIIGLSGKIISAHSILNSMLLGIVCSNKIGREFEPSVQRFLQDCINPAIACTNFTLIDFAAIRHRLLNVVYPDKDGHAHSRADSALLAYCKKDFITDEAKQEIEAIEGLSNLAERRKRFKRLLEAGDNGILESTVDFLIKTEFDIAVDFLLTDQTISFHRRMDCTKNVMGVAASKDHIAVICQQSDEVLVFDNVDGKTEIQFQKLKISGMTRPWDVIAHMSSIVVSDEESKCLWKIDDWEDHLKFHFKQYSGISKKNTYRLGALARNLNGRVMVHMTKDEQSKWKDIIEFTENKSIIGDDRYKVHDFGSNVIKPSRVAPFAKCKSYAVIHQMDTKTPSTRSVDLVQSDGKLHEYSSFIHSLCDAVHLNKPESVAVDEDGRIFIADCNNCRIVVIQDGRSISVVKLGENEHPHKLCYVPERRQLIVGLVSNVVLVFNSSPK